MDLPTHSPTGLISSIDWPRESSTILGSLNNHKGKVLLFTLDHQKTTSACALLLLNGITIEIWRVEDPRNHPSPGANLRHPSQFGESFLRFPRKRCVHVTCVWYDDTREREFPFFFLEQHKCACACYILILANCLLRARTPPELLVGMVYRNMM